MSVRVTQLSYNSGVLSGLMEGRADDTKYASGLAVCRNAMCTPQGPVQNRPGFMYVNSTKDSSKRARLIPFTYSADQTMIIELGDKYARFHTQGKTLLKPGTSEPYEIETPWKESELFEIHYTQNAEVMTLVHINHQPREIRRYSLVDWRCEPVVLISSLTPPQGVTATKITSAANDDNANKYTQTYVVTALNEDRTEESTRSSEAEVVANLYATGTTVRVSWDKVEGASFYRVYKLQGGLFGYIGETQGLDITDDNIAPETGITPPYLDDIFGMTGGITSVRVTNQGGGYTGGKVSNVRQTGKIVTWLYINSKLTATTYDNVTLPWSTNFGLVDRNEYAITGTGTGAKAKQTWGDYSGNARPPYTLYGIELISGGGGYQPGATLHMDNRSSNGVGTVMDFACDVIPTKPNVYVTDPTGYGAVLEADVEDGKIVAIRVINGGRNYTNPTVVIDPLDSGGSGATATAEVGKSVDYPSAVGYFEQRRIFAGSRLRPQQIWMTATGAENNMTYHLPLQDDDRISFAVASRDLNQIQHVVALQQLIMLTSAAEWRVSPLNSDAITPTSISVRPQSYVGASTVQPVLANNTAIYAASRGGHVREIAYNYTAGGYITGDLSLRATELFDNYTIVDLAYSKEPFPVVWAVSSSGALLGLTYVPEQQLSAWFEYKTDGVFESVSVVQEGLIDAVYCVVRRTIGGQTVRTVERMGKREDSSNSAGLYLDCAGVYDGEPTATVSGLTWLANQTVTVNADGAVYEGLQVGSDGALTLPVEAYKVYVGLPYSVEIETMPIVAGLSDGSLAKGHTKNINRVWLRVKNSAALEVGSNFDNMAQQKTRSDEAYGAAPDIVTGVVDVFPPGGWKDDSSACIRMAKPLPFTLVSHSAEIAVGG